MVLKVMITQCSKVVCTVTIRIKTSIHWQTVMVIFQLLLYL